MNVVVLQGALSSAPTERTLPSGDRLLSLEVTVRDEGSANTSVPVVWFSPPARAARLDAGTAVVVSGQVRRRFFRTGAGASSRTEVVASHVLPVTQRVRVSGLLDQVVATLVDS